MIAAPNGDNKTRSELIRSLQVAPIIRELNRYKKGGNVLDLGAGTGRHALFLAAQGFEVTAVDLAAEKLSVLEARAKDAGLDIPTITASIATYEPAADYDVVIATMSLHFLSDLEIIKTVSVMKAHTKPHGINIISGLTDKHPPRARPHLFAHNELADLYADWEMLHYEEEFSAPFQSRSGELIQQHRAVLMARKPCERRCT